MLHLNITDLEAVMKRIDRALKPAGILYTSFKYGEYEMCIRDRNYILDLASGGEENEKN